MRVRGDSDIYYLDFTDILTIVRENWPLFKGYFESQYWISVKLDELRDCRNVVAHNGYLGEIEKGIILTNYQAIIQQIALKIKN